MSTNQNNADMQSDIRKLLKEKNAVLLAHNYCIGDLQDIADFVGDSLELSLNVLKTDADRVVFAGVPFMAETASLLSPNREILFPRLDTTCPMADMVDLKKLMELKAEYPDAAVVCYMNTTAEIKAYSDICVTSANALRIVNSLPNKQIIFLPDMNLGSYISKHTEKEIILYNGYCPTHQRVKKEDIIRLKAANPTAEFICHPECRPDVVDLADHVCSTSGFYTYVKNSKADKFIIGTESGVLHRLVKENSGKQFFLPYDQFSCANIKMVTVEDVYNSLLFNRYVVSVDEKHRVKALNSITRMINSN